MRIPERGQITIPKALRDRFGLHHNVEVEISPTDRGLLIRKRTAAKPSCLRILGRDALGEGVSIDDYIGNSGTMITAVDRNVLRDIRIPRACPQSKACGRGRRHRRQRSCTLSSSTHSDRAALDGALQEIGAISPRLNSLRAGTVEAVPLSRRASGSDGLPHRRPRRVSSGRPHA